MKIQINNKGFSITEVLIALLIISIVSLALFFALSIAFKIKKQNEKQLFASKFAEEKMIFIKHDKKNYLKKVKYDTVPSLKEKITEEKIPWKITDLKKITYIRITEIKIETLSPLLMHAWVTVKWMEDDKEKKYILESYL